MGQLLVIREGPKSRRGKDTNFFTACEKLGSFLYGFSVDARYLFTTVFTETVCCSLKSLKPLDGRDSILIIEVLIYKGLY